jgi:hypothetical protein
MSVGVEFKQKRMFFDRANVVAQVGKRNAAFLSRVGAFTQRRARSSLRRRKRPSVPGTPPSVHSQSDVATLKNIWFAYEPGNQSVVIGPLRLNLHSATWGGGRTLTKGAVPGILEHGGRVGIRKIKGSDGKFYRVPFGHRRRAERLVPVWKATAAERSASNGIVKMPLRNGRGSANFYRIPNPPSVIVWVDIAARPFMGPAGAIETKNATHWSATKKAA